MNSKDMAMIAAKALQSKKANDIKLIDIAEKSSFADFLLVTSARTDRQIEALSDEVEYRLEKEGVQIKGIEGRSGSGWILIDAGDIIVNIFLDELREKYGVEKIWADCTILDMEECDNEA